MLVIDGVEMVDMHEAGRLADRTPETIRRWVWSGRLEARKDGNRLLVSRGNLLALSSKGRQDHDDLTLADWLLEAREVQARAMRGSTARDLVLADRDVRSGRDAGR